MYQKKVRADAIDDKAGHAREPLPELVEDTFTMVLFPDNSVAAKRAMQAMVNGIKKVEETSTRARLFGTPPSSTHPTSKAPPRLASDTAEGRGHADAQRALTRQRRHADGRHHGGGRFSPRLRRLFLPRARHARAARQG